LDVVMPQLGETVQEGTVISWYKNVGDTVHADEPLFDVETEKVTTEIPAPADGVLTAILVATGVAVPVGTRLAVIETAPATSNGPARFAQAPSSGPPASPPGPTSVAAAATDDIRIPLSKIRRQTAAHMARSIATSPHVLQVVEVDFERVEQSRRRRNPAWKTSAGFSLTYLPFIARAVCEAISEFPWVNSSYAGEELIVHQQVHLGIAVDLDFQGLVVPVVRDAQRRSVPELAKQIHRLATAARGDALAPDDVGGATYTISNPGPYGTLLTAPIISQPQVAILSTDGVRKKPVVIEAPGGDQIVVHPVGLLAQSFDHRAFDGAYSAAFLRRVREIIESRDWLADLPE
jgi:pyruvate dehydrogenase E2 component (dihydrolipoamide acetyltransferase)